MAFGITSTGFIIKRLEDIKDEIETSLRSFFGNGVNLEAESVLGTLVGIYSEREALVWELAQACYNSQYPDTAQGVSLDYVAGITGIERLDSTFSTAIINAKGTLATIITEGSIVSVDGNSDSRFVTDADGTIAAGTDEIQTISFSAVPDAGSFTLIIDGEETGAILFSDAAIDVQNALNALTGLSAVTVAGSFAANFVITFAGADGSQPQSPITEGNTNTLTLVGAGVTISVVETTPGLLPNIDINVTAETAGAVAAPAASLTVIETPIAGWASCTNALDATLGQEIETDAELRIRRLQTLAAPGSATVDAIRAEILDVDDVTAALVFENDTNAVDIAGRPAKSVEAVVLDGVDADIAEALWDVKPAGIETFGGVTVVVTDSQGFTHDVNFSRPTPVPIWLEVDITIDSDFPVGGATAIETSIITFAEAAFSISDDVITTQLYESIHDIAGITDIDLRIGIANVALVQTLTMDADFVGANVIDVDVAGTGIASVTYAVSHANTMTLLAAAIQLLAGVVTATVTAAREITVTSAAAGTPQPMSNFVVTLGVSQADAAIETTSHTDDNIEIAVDEIATWDTARIVVTDII